LYGPAFGLSDASRAGRQTYRPHTGGWNSATTGIALLGTYTSATIPSAARSSLVKHLAWEAEHHSIDPLATRNFTNPSSGAQRSNPTISGHRDWTATECPGDNFYSSLPSIRRDVAALAASQSKSFAPASTVVSKGTTGSSATDLATNDGVYYQVASVKPSTKFITDWYGVAQIDVSGVRKFVLTYDGSATSAVTQDLYAYNFTNKAWQKVSSSAVSTADRTLTWPTNSPGPFVSGGQSRFRVRSTSDSSFTSNGDLMRFQVSY
jgi:N-acetylmuramoyl-L-alanine amidase-like protein